MDGDLADVAAPVAKQPARSEAGEREQKAGQRGEICRPLWSGYPVQIGRTCTDPVTRIEQLGADEVAADAGAEADGEVDPLADQIEIAVRQDESELEPRETPS